MRKKTTPLPAESRRRKNQCAEILIERERDALLPRLKSSDFPSAMPGAGLGEREHFPTGFSERLYGRGKSSSASNLMWV